MRDVLQFMYFIVHIKYFVNSKEKSTHPLRKKNLLTISLKSFLLLNEYSKYIFNKTTSHFLTTFIINFLTNTCMCVCICMSVSREET